MHILKQEKFNLDRKKSQLKSTIKELFKRQKTVKDLNRRTVEPVKPIKLNNEVFDVLIKRSQVDPFGDRVDEILKNSYIYYYNRPCRNCSKLFTNGKSRGNCDSKHHRQF